MKVSMKHSYYLIMGIMILLLIPIYYLSINTPFRLIDDYGDWMFKGRLFHYLTYFGQGRYRPVYEYGNEIYWSLWGVNYSLHHFTRLMMKIFPFIFLYRLTRNLIPLQNKENEWLSLIFMFALYFFFPNNPESRLAPQELTSAFFMSTMLYCIMRKNFTKNDYFFSFISFSLFLFSKENNIVPGLIVLLFIVYRLRCLSLKYVWMSLPFVIIFCHTFMKVYMAAISGGYGTNSITMELFFGNCRNIVKYTLLPGGCLDPFLTFFMLFPFFYFFKVKTKRSVLSYFRDINFIKENVSLYFLVVFYVATVFTFTIGWSSVLRYAYLQTFLYILIVSLIVRSCLSQRKELKLMKYSHFLSLMFVLLVYPNFYFQFSVQNVAGNFERNMLNQLESIKGEKSIFLLEKNEYAQKIYLYFTEYRKFFYPQLQSLKIGYGKDVSKDLIDYDYILTSNQRLLMANREKLELVEKFIPGKDLFPVFHPLIMKLNYLHILYWFNPARNYLWADAGAGLPFPWFLVKRK